MKHCKRKIIWDRDGVSEIIGTILTLSITVVLFSGIIMMVNQFPAPGDRVYTDFSAYVEPRFGDWEEGAFIHITNTGGQVMSGEWTLIVLAIDSHTFTLRTKGNMSDDGGHYGLGPSVLGHRGPDNGDDNWDTGERWTVYRDNASISQNSEVSAMILDQGRNALVWSSRIQGSGNRFGPVISNIRVDSEPESLRLAPIQYGRQFYIYADLHYPDGNLSTLSVHADLSSITLPDNVAMYHIGDGVFRSGFIMGPGTTVPLGYHIAMVHAVDSMNNMSSKAAGRIPVGLDLKGQPNFSLYDIFGRPNVRLSDTNPMNWELVTLTVTVTNHGGNSTGTLTVHDVIDPVGDPDGKLVGTVNFKLADGPAEVTENLIWRASPGGRHMLRFEAWPVDAIDAQPALNVYFLNMTVMPRILLVDDDNHPENFGPGDTASFMRGALDSCDFSYHYHRVAQGSDGPPYDTGTGESNMANYDIVIWLTGYEGANTLRAADRANLHAYLNDSLEVGRAGSLWLVGQHLIDDPNVQSSFLENTLKLDAWTHSADGPGPELSGVAGNPISREWENETIPLITRLEDRAGGWEIQPRSDANVTFNMDNNTGHALNYENEALDSRLVFFPWEFSRIRDTGDQAKVAYRVLNWLGNLQNRTGDDLAISEQTIDPSFVFFNQKVNVTAVIRNNGPRQLTTEAGLYLVNENKLITEVRNIEIPGNGGTHTVSGTWTADRLGTQVLKWKVDHNNEIRETNEANNMVPDHIHDGKVFVEFRILVVDDDSSTNNNGTMPDDTGHLTDSLSRLGYLYESHSGVNTPYVVMNDDDGPDIDYLKDYSAVFWVGGNSPGALTNNDTNALRHYLLNYQGRLWLSGNDLFSGLSVANRTSLLDALGIAGVAAGPLSGTMRGVDLSGISHGMNISVTANNQADMLSPGAGTGALHSHFPWEYSAVKHDSEGYHAFTSGFNLSTLYGPDPAYIAGDNAVDELTYMLLRWMDRPETRNELRITEKDYFLNDWHPQIGGAYVLRARVHNVGGNPANFLIRFMDGDVQIGSDTVSLSPGAMGSAEMIWRPLFAGQRRISILADPLGEVDEIFPWFNNNISFNIYVYFFWDDMESGTSKWSHASTVVNINGEGPLDYYSGSADVSIHDDWDGGLSYGGNWTNKSAHSHPNSYFMEEPVGDLVIQADVYVAISIDASDSMKNRFNSTGASFQEAAINGARILVDSLSDGSVVVLVGFQGSNTVISLEATMLDTVTNRSAVDTALDNWESPGGQTILWDSIGLGYDTVNNDGRWPELHRAVVTLTDGCDYGASDTGVNWQLVEAGSEGYKWSPWHEMYTDGTETSYRQFNYKDRRAKYTIPWGTNAGEWTTLSVGPGGAGTTRKGLLQETRENPLPIYTIGLGLEHNPTIPNWNVMTEWPGDGQVNNAHVYINPSDSMAIESGTVEYNLWRIANTSGAEYFYSPDGDDLRDIFESISRLIIEGSGGFNQTRSSTPAPASEPGTRSSNTDKWATTPAFSLVDVERAQLSFWHRYKIRQGANGVYMEIGFWNATSGQWEFRYIVPPGRYTGMLLHEQYSQTTEYDDFGNQIQWCWNGVSGKGLFTWDHVSFDLMPFVREHPDADLSQVVARFYYKQYGGGAKGNGWYIDDVKLDVTRAEYASDTFGELGGHRDVWVLTDQQFMSDGHSWGNYIIPGNDNYLMTSPIDLTGARNAQLSAYFKFNIPSTGGQPPDGFRVEVSGDGGATWIALNSGLNLSGDSDWIEAGNLVGLNVDLSDWRGGQIFIRFRMVSNNAHNSLSTYFFVDDVQVTGDSIYG